MRLSFIYPLALLLLVLLPLLWAFTLLARGGSAGRASWRFWASLGLRSVALLSLVLSLAGTQLVRPVSALTVVFLIDGSDSVAPAQRQQASEIVSEALRAKQPGDQAAVVLFGENALVERAPSPLVDLGRLTSTPIGTRTNIAEA
ncbi:MAG: VWA domain-containing protein, partial [Chloroflexales bacterium]|nr:VWA domain-containing protein [Chloroflexales bacterium]